MQLELFETRNYGELVEEFQIAMGVDPSEETRALYAKLIVEETKEVREAMANLLKELCDLDYVVHGYMNLGGDVEDVIDLIGPNVNTDISVALHNAFPPEVERVAFIRVHQSNMSKLGEDGKPIRREDGKVQKGPNYKPPELQDLVSAPEAMH